MRTYNITVKTVIIKNVKHRLIELDTIALRDVIESANFIQRENNKN